MDPNSSELFQTVQDSTQAAPLSPPKVDQPLPNILSCPTCKYVIQSDWYFCPNCSRKLKHKPRSTSAWAQTKVYLLSILLPPLGIFPGIGYLFEKSGKAKIVGLVCILLTGLSLYLTTIYTMYIVQQVETELTHAVMPLAPLNVDQSQTKELQHLGF